VTADFIDPTIDAGVIQDAPALTIAKSANLASGHSPAVTGDVIDYSFLVKNTGNVALTNVSVADGLPGLSPISCPSSTLAVGASMACTATYTVTAADAQAGQVDNSATATGTPPPGDPGPVTSPPGKTSTPTKLRYALGDYVWIDVNHDGVQTGGEPALQNVTVKLFDSSGTQIKTTTTDSAGHYLFDDLDAGTYSVQFVLPASYHFTTQNTGSDVTVDSNADVSTGKSGPITLNTSDSNLMAKSAYSVQQLNADFVDPTIDAGVIKDAPGIAIVKSATVPSGHNPARTGDVLDYSFSVTNSGNVPLTNVTVTDGLAGLSAISCPATTLAVGANMICTATYTVTEADAAAGTRGNTATATGTPPGGGTTTSTGTSSTPTELRYAIGDYVWVDTNGNGIQDAGEQPVVGDTVVLVNSAGAKVGTTSTDANGHYVFDDLAAGTYTVQFGLPAGYAFTRKNVGSNTSVDSNPDATGSSGPIVLGSTDAQLIAKASYPGTIVADFIDPTIDAGVVVPVSVGDYVWVDTNGNGVQDSGEPGIPGVTVTITDPSGKPVADVLGNPVGPQVTDSNGKYEFANLPPGQYVTHVNGSQATLSGYAPTKTGRGTAATDSSTGSATSAVLPSGGSDQSLDFGFVKPVSVGDYVWVDTNGNGVQDSGEPGIPGVSVTITDSAGNPVTDVNGNPVGPQVTDSNGKYEFTNLPPGQYLTHVNGAQAALGGFSPTLTGQGTAATDSSTGSATSAVLPSGGSDQSLDFGFVKPVAVGDYVWVDENLNGIQDNGEPALPGVTVELLTANGTPAVDIAGNAVASTTTDANGHYVFDDLRPGQYEIAFSDIPDGYSFTTQFEATGTAATDSNADPDTGITPVFTVDGTDADTRAVTAGDGTTNAVLINPTIDAGIAPPLFAVGDYVWVDANHNGVQDSGEKPVTGATATLLNADGTPATYPDGSTIPSTTTDANGHYVFDGVPAGAYKIQFSGLPATYLLTTQSVAGASEANDSNPDSSGLTPAFEVGLSAANMRLVQDSDGTSLAYMINPTIDAGIFEPVSAMGGGDQDQPGLASTGPVNILGEGGIAVGLVICGLGLLLLTRRRESD